MSKLVRKFLFGDLFNTGEYEEYFAEMSRQGYHLEKLGSHFAYFKEGAPNHLNYRIDMVPMAAKEEEIEKHKEEGWDFICERDNYIVVSSPANSELYELYKTPQEQKSSLAKAGKEVTGHTPLGLVITFIATLVIILLSYQMIQMEGGLILSLIRGTIILPIVFVTFSYISQLGRYLSFKKFEKSLDSGEFLNHSKNYSLLRRKYITKRVISLAIILLIISTLLYKVSKEEFINLSEIENLSNLPVISIRDIEGEAYKRAHSRVPIIKDDGIDYGNYIRKSWSSVVPREYALIETGIFEKKELEESNPLLITDYYSARTEGIARLLEKEIKSREEGYGCSLEKLDEEGEYIFYGTERDEIKNILCRKGKELVYVQYYHGTASMEDIKEAIIRKLEM